MPEGIWPEEYKFLFADFVWYTVYSLTEDSDNECRSCKPPISRFRNETFFETISYPGEHKNEAKIVRTSRRKSTGNRSSVSSNLIF